MPAHAYADRLLVEGAVLAATGAAGSVALLATQPEARRWPHQTIGQLALVAAVLLGPLTARVRRDVRTAPRVLPWRLRDGDPTPLHHVPVPVAAGVVLVAPLGRRVAVPRELRRRAGWDAALRVTGGALLVGLWQALVLAPLVRREQGRRTVVRLRGSRLGATRLGRR